ncbi:MAG: hypothetical protein J6V07_07415 [Clostridia bacterium]|nr:hypothetical protein [Clostridia bacterium]
MRFFPNFKHWRRRGRSCDCRYRRAGHRINISSDSAYTEEIAYFLNTVRTGVPTSLVTPESALGTIRLIERIVANAKRV